MKKLTVIGIMGKTHGVTSDKAPQKIPNPMNVSKSVSAVSVVGPSELESAALAWEGCVTGGPLGLVSLEPSLGVTTGSGGGPNPDSGATSTIVTAGLAK